MATSMGHQRTQSTSPTCPQNTRGPLPRTKLPGEQGASGGRQCRSPCEHSLAGTLDPALARWPLRPCSLTAGTFLVIIPRLHPLDPGTICALSTEMCKWPSRGLGDHYARVSPFQWPSPQRARARQWDSPAPADGPPPLECQPALSKCAWLPDQPPNRQICSLTLRGSSLTQDGLPKTVSPEVSEGYRCGGWGLP